MSWGCYHVTFPSYIVYACHRFLPSSKRMQSDQHVMRRTCSSTIRRKDVETCLGDKREHTVTTVVLIHLLSSILSRGTIDTFSVLVLLHSLAFLIHKSIQAHMAGRLYLYIHFECVFSRYSFGLGCLLVFQYYRKLEGLCIVCRYILGRKSNSVQ